MSTPRLFSSLLLAAGLVCAHAQDAAAPASAPEPPQTEMQKWIATADAQWQAAFKREVADVHEAELNKVKLFYLTSLEDALKKVSSAGDLDGAVVLRNEQKRFAETNVFPEHDGAADAASVKQLRAAIRAQLGRVEKESAVRAKALHAKYDQMLAQAQTQLTQRQRIDDALLVKAKRDEVAAVWLAGIPAAPAAAAVPPAAATNAPKPAASTRALPVGTRLAENMILYASGNNGCVIYLNGKEVVKAMRDQPSTFKRRLHEGDVIAVHNQDRFDINSFWLSCLASTGEFLFETSEKWNGYLPADTKKWWDTKNIKEQSPAQFAPDRQQYVDLVKKSASQTPLSHGAQPIRSSLTDGTRSAYLWYVITKQDLILKNDPPPSGK